MFKILLSVAFLIPLAANAELTFPTTSTETALTVPVTSTEAEDYTGNDEDWTEYLTETIPLELKKIVVRKGKELVIKKETRILVKFVDVVGIEHYRFEWFNKKSNCAFVSINHRDGLWNNGVLINYSSGTKLQVPSEPIWSPSETRFVIAYSDKSSFGYSNNDAASTAADVWHLENNMFVQKWGYPNGKSGDNWLFIDSATWVSENEVNFYSAKKQVLNCKYQNNEWSCKNLKTRLMEPADKNFKNHPRLRNYL